MRITKHSLSALFAIFILIGLSACTETLLKTDVAERIAKPAWMLKRVIPAGAVSLTAYERMHERHTSANLYIEGENTGWTDKVSLWADPTPKNPTALNLAAYDKAKNVVYLARPCQFTHNYYGVVNKTPKCDEKYWKESRFSSEVINAYENALDNIKALYNITEFHATGYGGGGAIATILAARRNDITTLKTVAGHLDHKVLTAHHELSPLRDSLNAVDYADRLASIPQHHFIGGQDSVVPSAVFSSYLQAMGPAECLQYSFIQNADHDAGWVSKWPELQKIPLPCTYTPANDTGSFTVNEGDFGDFSSLNADFPEGLDLIPQSTIYRVPRDLGVKP